MENPIKMDDLGGKPTIFGNIHIQAEMLPFLFLRIMKWLAHMAIGNLFGSPKQLT